MNRNDAIGGVLVFLFGALTACLSLRMPIGTFRVAGSGMFPLCLGLLLMALSGAYTIGVLLRTGGTLGKKEAKSLESSASTKRVIYFIGAIVLAVALLKWLGYPLTSFLLVLALLKIFGMKRWAWSILIAVSASAVCYFLFVLWLKIPFPKGLVGL